jgi:hypothetical protein
MGTSEEAELQDGVIQPKSRPTTKLALFASGRGSLQMVFETVEGYAIAVYSRESAFWGGGCAVQTRGVDSSVRVLRLLFLAPVFYLSVHGENFMVY